jgi:hypothetical protein
MNDEQLILTWARPSLWREANRTIDYLVQRHASVLTRTSHAVCRIQAGFGQLFDLMEDLCSCTCSWCPEPCCAVARVWIDFCDLIFLHLGRLPIPDEQLFYENQKICRYLGSKGCTLERISRPWACTRYLCPTQMKILRKKGRPFQNALEHSITSIKDGRKILKAEFLRAIC